LDIFLIRFTVCAGFSFAQPTILAPTHTDEIIIDNGATGKADPNDPKLISAFSPTLKSMCDKSRS